MYYTESFEEDYQEEGDIFLSLHLARPNKVKDRLYIGCQDSARNKLALKNLKISHILNLTGTKPHFPDDFDYLTLEKLDDAPYVDVLCKFPECIEFIERGMKDGSGVLVHCTAGVSRSGCIVLAFLMKSNGISLQEALSIVKESRPMVQPNCGFMKQLHMWEVMECNLEGNSKAHRIYSLEKMSKKYCESGILPETTLGKDPSQIMSCDSDSILHCSHCHRELFSNANIISHPKGVGHSTNQWCSSQDECDSYYIEPMEWMGNIRKAGGQINCPSCEAEIGSWTWRETKCNCGSVVNPSFRIPKNFVVERIRPNSFS